MESLPLLEVELELEFTAIYKRELRFVWENVRRLGVPARDLPDVTHDVFVAVFKNLWKYDGERPLRPWLFGVLFRVTSDHLRLARNQREVLDIAPDVENRSEEHTSELQSQFHLVCRLLLEKKK